jgi:hypothetical protein
MVVGVVVSAAGDGRAAKETESAAGRPLVGRVVGQAATAKM